MKENDRFDAIMTIVLEWAEHSAGWWCQDEAEQEVRFFLENEEFADWSDEQIADQGIKVWQEAE
jgi:hypothetical protein